MQRIDTPTAQKNKFGTGKNGFTDGDPLNGISGTALDSVFFDSVQEEICSVIESAGITLDVSQNNQLLTAITQIIGNTASQPRTFSPDLPGSVMMAVIRAVPADYPAMPTSTTTMTVLYPETGYLLPGSNLSYGAMNHTGDCISWGTRYFTGSWALLSGLVGEYDSSNPATPIFGNFLAQSVDVSGLSLSGIQSAMYLDDSTDYVNATFSLPAGKQLIYTAWKNSPLKFNRDVYNHCTTQIIPAQEEQNASH